MLIQSLEQICNVGGMKVSQQFHRLNQSILVQLCLQQ
jgi:hypothetical protein